MSASGHAGQKRALNLSELEFQAGVSLQMWMLGNELASYGRAVFLTADLQCPEFPLTND